MRRACALALALSVCAPGLAYEGPRIQSMQQLKFSGIQRQTLDYSCGAAALTILLNQYFGDSVREQDLLADIVYRLPPEEMVNRIQEGFSMLDLKTAAENAGYDATGILLPKESVGLLPGPVIILLRRETLNHFVVLKGVQQGRAFLADPARGHLRIPLHELFEQWHGETLVLGRDGVGLLKAHALAIPNSGNLYPESQTVRELQHLPFK